MHRTLTTLVLATSLLALAGGATAATAAKDGRYYFDAMKASMLEVLAENQKLINTTPAGAVKDKTLVPEADYARAYESFTEIAGEDFSVADLGSDPAAIAQALGTMLQAGREVTAKAQVAINTESDGTVKPKKFIPAVFGRLVADRFAKKTGVVMKQTTLGKNGYGARNEYNAPDEWETTALTKISAAGWERNKGFGEQVGGAYRLAKPIYIKDACLTCHGDPVGEAAPYGHAKEGYKVGELRGAISVTIPTGPGV